MLTPFQMRARRRPALTALLLCALLPLAEASAAVSLSPKRLVAGDVARVAIRVSGAGQGAWKLAASEGTLTAPVQQPDGSATATLTLANDRRPRIVQLAAWRESAADPASVDFASLGVSGRVLVPVQTEPGATVSVNVAGARFGPAVAGADGHAELELTVPPGVRSARVEVLSTAGGRSTETLDLGTPDFNHLFGVVLPVADGAALVLAWEPAAEAPKPSAVRFEGVSFRALGEGRFVGERKGSEAFRGTVRAAGSSVVVEHAPRIRSEVKIALSASRGEAGETVIATVHLTPADLAPRVQLALDGEPMGVAEVSDGVAELKFALPPVPKPRTGRLTVVAGTLGGEAAIAIEPARAVSLEVTTSDEPSGISVAVAGRSRTGIAAKIERPTARVAQSSDDAPLTLVPAGGPDSEGTWRFVLRVPPDRLGVAAIEVTAGELTESIDVDLSGQPLARASILAMAGARGLAGGIGPELSAAAGWNLWRSGLLTLSAGASTGFHYGFGNAAGALVQVMEVPLIPELRVELTRKRLRFAAAGGAGGELAMVRVENGGVAANLLPALQFRSRVGVRGGPGFMFVAADIRIPLFSNRLGVGSSDLGGLGLFLGYELLVLE